MVVAVTDEEFALWFERDYRSLVAAVSLVCSSSVVAEEAVMEAFTKAYARRRSVEAMSSPSAWVYRVAVNEVRMGWRRKRLERRGDPRRQSADVEHLPEVHHELWRAVGRLPRRQREVVALRYLVSYTQAEIAHALGISAGTVASTLHDARTALAKALNPKEDADAHHH